jgi:hypothetical protein
VCQLPVAAVLDRSGATAGDDNDRVATTIALRWVQDLPGE